MNNIMTVYYEVLDLLDELIEELEKNNPDKKKENDE